MGRRKGNNFKIMYQYGELKCLMRDKVRPAWLNELVGSTLGRYINKLVPSDGEFWRKLDREISRNIFENKDIRNKVSTELCCAGIGLIPIIKDGDVLCVFYVKLL